MLRPRIFHYKTETGLIIFEDGAFDDYELTYIETKRIAQNELKLTDQEILSFKGFENLQIF